MGEKYSILFIRVLRLGERLERKPKPTARNDDAEDDATGTWVIGPTGVPIEVGVEPPTSSGETRESNRLGMGGTK